MKTLFLLPLLCAHLAFAAATPDVLFVNGNIHTGSEKQPHASAIATQGDRITFVGSDEDARKLATKTTRTVDLHGQTVLPGLTDSHCHIFGVGEREMTLNLEGTRTREDFLAQVQARAAATAPNEWITGRGWIETFWKPATFPTAAELDEPLSRLLGEKLPPVPLPTFARR